MAELRCASNVRSSRPSSSCSLTVIGAFSFTQPGRRSLSEDRLPDHHGDDGPARRRAGADRNRDHRQDRGRRSTPSAASTSCGRSRLKASRRSSSRFLLDKDTDVAAQEVRDKVNGVLPQLPKTIQQPRVDQMDPDAAPVLSLALSAKTSRCADITGVRRQGAAPADRERQRRRPGARPRRPPAADQRVARRRSPARLQPDRHRRLARAAGAEHRDSRRPRRSGAAVGHAADPRPRPDRRRVQRHRRPREERPSGPDRATSRASRTARPSPRRSPTSNGAGTVLLQVRRQSGTNTVEVVNEVKRAARRARRRRCRPATTSALVRDTSDFIEASIHNVEEHLDRRLDPGRARRAAVPDATCARRSSPRSRSRPRSSRPSA